MQKENECRNVYCLDYDDRVNRHCGCFGWDEEQVLKCSKRIQYDEFLNYQEFTRKNLWSNLHERGEKIEIEIDDGNNQD